MTDSEFWAIVEKTVSPDQDAQLEALETQLRELSEKDLIGFEHAFHAKRIESYSWDLWAGAYIINGGCSDDSFDYFRDWLLAKGETVYNNAINDPQSLIGVAEPWGENDFEGFGYVAREVFEDKFGKDLPSSKAKFPSSPAGQAWDEEDVENKYPKLAKWVNESVDETPVAPAAPPQKLNFWQRLFGKK